MRVPFINLRAVNARWNVRGAVSDVLDSGIYLHGRETVAFEKEFASYTRNAHCVTLANGLDALRITLLAWISLGRLDRGDEVLVPANSFVASALAITQAGLEPRFMDVNPLTFNSSLENVQAAITRRTRAVMIVHLFGQLSEIEAIHQFCKAKGLLLLEDAAQAHGARLPSGACAGALGDATGFSFYPTKNLGALGDAGCMVTNERDLAERVRTIANYGAPRKYFHEYLGTNSRMDELQAAVLRLKLPFLDRDNERRREIARRYTERISDAFIATPATPSFAAAHVWHIYAIVVEARDSLMHHLQGKGIQTSVHYPCAIHKHPAYFAHRDQSAPMSERLQHQILSLPISPVMQDSEVDYVIDCLNAWQGPDATFAMQEE